MSNFFLTLFALCIFILVILPIAIVIGIPAELAAISLAVLIAGISIYKSMKHTASFHDTFTYSIPFQVLKLVQQAHMNQTFNTDPHIRVSSEMREKLLHPLNRTLAAINGTTDYPVTEHEFKYDIAESKYVNNDLHVTVSINIDYCDTARSINVHYHDVLLYIVCSPVKNDGLHITSVEHN